MIHKTYRYIENYGKDNVKQKYIENYGKDNVKLTVRIILLTVMFKIKYKEIEWNQVKINQSVVSQHDDRIGVNDSVINMSGLIKSSEVNHRTKACLFRRSLCRRLHVFWLSCLKST